MTPERWRFYEVFGLFRLAVIAQQIWYRYFHQQTTNEAYAVFGPAVGYLETRCRVADRRLMGRRAAGPARPGVVRRRRLRRALRDRLGAEPAARRLPRRARGDPDVGAARRHAPAPRDRRGRWSRAPAGRRRSRPTRAGTSSTTSASSRRTRDLPPRPRARPPRVPAGLRAGHRSAGRPGSTTPTTPSPTPAFRARVAAALARACDRAGPGGTVVVVSSGGPIATACASLVAPEEDDPAVLAGLWRRFNTVIVNTSVTRVARRLHRRPAAHLQRAPPPRGRPPHLPLTPKQGLGNSSVCVTRITGRVRWTASNGRRE